ncbi:MAG: efflux transporter periplasmic adaptor subunit, partial [Clostridia bacterium]|nr:efflux transporter periplasmic adaptor subunit [Clostridia bacterium]
NGVTTYPVTVEITDFDDQLLPGMNIDAEIVTSNIENALCVPVSAVNRGNTVYVKGEKTDENDRAPEGFHSVKVETGAYNDEWIEITAGLSEGDIVYVPQQASRSFSMEDMMGGMQGFGGMGGMSGSPGGMGGGMNRPSGSDGSGRPSGMR